MKVQSLLAVAVGTAVTLSLTLLSCGGKDKSGTADSSAEVAQMESAADGDKQNPLYGRIYRDKNEIPELNDWEDLGGCSIRNSQFSLSVSGFAKRNDNYNISEYFFTLQQLVRHDDKGRAFHKILYAINIGTIKSEEYVTRCLCHMIEDYSDNGIIAVVVPKNSDEEYYETIIKAWHVNKKTERFEPITDLKRIRCVNEEYGI